MFLGLMVHIIPFMALLDAARTMMRCNEKDAKTEQKTVPITPYREPAAMPPPQQLDWLTPSIRRKLADLDTIMTEFLERQQNHGNTDQG